MLSPCSPRIIARTCVAGSLSVDAMREQKREVSSAVREDVHGIRDHHHDGLLLQPGLLEAPQNAEEEGDIAVDEIEAGLVGLAAQAGGDADEVRIGAIGVRARLDVLVSGKGGAMHEVQRLALGGGLVGIEQRDLFYDPGALQGECRAGPDAPAPAYDCNFHDVAIC
jgi:hypothetical protein